MDIEPLSLHIVEGNKYSDRKLYSVYLKGRPYRTIVSSDVQVMMNWFRRIYCILDRQPVGDFVVGLGIDYEENNNVNKIEHQLATIQLYHEEQCLLMQLTYMSTADMAPLRQFLMNPRIVFSCMRDPDFLAQILSLDPVPERRLTVGRMYDLRLMCPADLLNAEPTEIIHHFFNINLPLVFNADKSGWIEPILGLTKIMHASIEAYACAAIAIHLLETTNEA